MHSPDGQRIAHQSAERGHAEGAGGRPPDGRDLPQARRPLADRRLRSNHRQAAR
jgi:hypothetical protein